MLIRIPLNTELEVMLEDYQLEVPDWGFRRCLSLCILVETTGGWNVPEFAGISDST